MAGEDGNYIHNRAQVEGSTAAQVLIDIARELLEVRASIYAVLSKIPRAAETWHVFEHGYMYGMFLLLEYRIMIYHNIGV
jgi:hypothetical protein